MTTSTVTRGAAIRLRTKRIDLAFTVQSAARVAITEMFTATGVTNAILLGLVVNLGVQIATDLEEAMAI